MKRLGSVANSALEWRKDSSGGEETQAVGCITHLRKLGLDLVDPRGKVALEALEVIVKFFRRRTSLLKGSVPPCSDGFGTMLQRNTVEQVSSQQPRPPQGCHFPPKRRDLYGSLGHAI